jgi:hypothetical protein
LSHKKPIKREFLPNSVGGLKLAPILDFLPSKTCKKT